MPSRQALSPESSRSNEPPTTHDQMALGKGARAVAPRAPQREWESSSTRPDPIPSWKFRPRREFRNLSPFGTAGCGDLLVTWITRIGPG